MRLGVLPGLYVYMNVSDSGTNSNILRHSIPTNTSCNMILLTPWTLCVKGLKK